MESVHVLSWIDTFDDLGLSDVLGQRELNQDAVDSIVGIQLIDAREQFDFTRAMRQIDRNRLDAALDAGRPLVAHVDG